MTRCDECGRELVGRGSRRGICDADYRRHLHRQDRWWARGAVDRRLRERNRLANALDSYWPIWLAAHGAAR